MGATGKFWAHEHWNLPSPPDYVTFAKKMAATGFYHTVDTRASLPYRNFNTWMGDPVRVLILESLVSQIHDYKLLDLVNQSGKVLMDGLYDIQKKYNIITNARGQGTFIAYDLPSAELQDKLVVTLRNNGVESTGCGARSVRIRPMLIFGPSHSETYLKVLRKSLDSM